MTRVASLVCALLLVVLAGCQVPQSASCREWVACSDALDARRGTVPGAAEEYGPSASCWRMPSSARECALECIEHLESARVMGASLPLECNPITLEEPAPYDPLPPPGPCSAPRRLGIISLGRPSIEPIDFDGDGRLDFVLADPAGSTLQLFRNDGTGRFAITDSMVGATAHDLHVSDVDRDGRPDVLMIETDQAILYAGQADGTFPYTTASDGYRGSGAVYEDFDGDDLLDVFLGGIAVDGVALYGRGRGDGTFAMPTSLLPGPERQIFATHAADLDEDGDLDVLTWLGNETLGVARNDGAGRFVFEDLPGTSVRFSRMLAVGDLDGDAHDDVVLVGPTTSGGDAPVMLAILFGAGTGALSGEQVLPLGTTTTLVRVEDVDGDGRAEVVIGDGAGLLVRRVSGDRTIGELEPTVVTVPVGDYFRADVDGDAAPDFVTTGPTGTPHWGSVTIFFACRT